VSTSRRVDGCGGFARDANSAISRRVTPPSYSVGVRADTDPETHRRQIEKLRAMTMDERAALVSALNSACDDLARAGIRRRHPDADEHEITMRLGALKYGVDLMREAYGWNASA
jgi:hypothetical protein